MSAYEPASEAAKIIKLEPTPSNHNGGAESSHETTKSRKKRSGASTIDKGNEEPKAKKTKVKSEPLSGATNGEATKRRSRGRKPAGSADAWTEEQDAYLRQLFTASDKTTIMGVHQQFEEKYNSGRSANCIKLHWYSLKDKSLVLSPAEEQILKKAVEKYENNKAAAVLDMYNKDGGATVTKLTQNFVSMKLKEWSKGNTSGAQKGDGGNDNKGSED
ncbi:hypothetical protein Dda_6352 [Drechslerella dactyloides]|uniref:Myb-like domain-containing protein n=1 Tax=Drechslerella dactyloides TaxID=74499 RepID=A0AAD6IXP2_DREDA|nr:hypothetical protein Dda_6352 [Drechslerella dactyloides]